MVLEVEYDHKVTDVRIHKLEDVNFVDHRVFQVLNKLVVLSQHQSIRKEFVNLPENDKEYDIDNTRDGFLKRVLIYFFLSPFVFFVLNNNLRNNDSASAEKSEQESQSPLDALWAELGHFDFLVRVRVNVGLAFKVFVFDIHLFNTSHEPFVCDDILLSLPALIKKSDPDHDNCAIDKAFRSVEHLIVGNILVGSYRDETECVDNTKNAEWNEPACVVH